jgi:hypothetical protein
MRGWRSVLIESLTHKDGAINAAATNSFALAATVCSLYPYAFTHATL